ncbi:RIIB lysis inhibitor [Rhizobium phage RHEph10]|uniref:RIIB lysis inhibitor n=1 Tax=Rhizobium phage RHEph10 TaxID=1220717 RepID=UPI0002AB63B1|nr:RIIB lysis inhibitor [Rhizobium phage RHEph10]AGC36128.1 putative rIIB-like protein [Rhizobium phage RHEph10]
MSKVRIISAIASDSGVTLYLETGNELNLKKDSARTKEILEKTIEALKRGEHMEIDTADFSIHQTIEEKTNGVVKFVRGRFSQLKALFGGEVEQPKMVTVELGSVKPVRAMPRQPEPTPAAKAPVAAPAVYEPEELHAVVNNTVIPDIDALTPYMDAIHAGEDALGFQKFMERIATVANKRSHTVKELLNFMSKGDLPIAEDGCIIGYKVLTTAPGNNGFVDRHSRKVLQKLGSYVQMDEKLIDPDRRNECSTGLHIARRGYLKGFEGSIITLVKVAPEDVIAVPPGEPDKMRAKAYHIVAVLPADVHAILRSNMPMTGNEKAAKLLADVVKGNHTPVLEIVNIGAAKGGNVTITPVDGAKKIRRAVVGTSGEAKALDDRPVAPGEETVPVSLKELRAKAADLDISKAAAAGDMSAAINATPQKMSRIKKTEPKPTPVVVDHAASAAPADKKAQALILHGEGKSNRAIEAELHICRKTLKKLFDKHGLKPNG